ncbi:MAG TPA: hypothetical protein VMY42_04460 [Thermoguttaceae bacterium]|nr:hypothetical protein [Thermoguttaceae bacterium]
MSYHISAERGQSFHVVRQAFLQDEQLPLANVLTEEEIEDFLRLRKLVGSAHPTGCSRPVVTAYNGSEVVAE